MTEVSADLLPDDGRRVVVHRPEVADVPVVLDSPHSGRMYPADFVTLAPLALLRKAEDTHVERLFGSAPRHGAVLIEALFPRAYIDPNRTLADLDPDLLDGPWPGPLAPGEKTRLGLGLVWKTLPDGPATIYRDRLSVGAVAHRIETCWRPYHAAVRQTIEGLHQRHGVVFHLNCHSMPSQSNAMSPEGPGVRRADIVLGDRDGTTTGEAFVALVERTMRAAGYEVRRNDPYKGVELVRAYSDPSRGRHSLQIEVARRLYMDEETLQPSAGFERLALDLDRLVASICAFACDAAKAERRDRAAE